MKLIIFIAFIFIIWFVFVITRKLIYSIAWLLLISIINFSSIFGVDVDVFIKFLFLLTYILLAFTNKINIKMLIPFFSIFILFFINLCNAKYGNGYNFYSGFSAVISIIIGFISLIIIYNENQKYFLLKLLSALPVISIIIGIILWPLGLCNPFQRGNYFALAGVSASTNLAFYSVIGIVTSLYVFYTKNLNKYRFIAYLNFFILCGTLTRGGILAGFIIIIYDLFHLVKKMLKTKNGIAQLFVITIFLFFPFFIIIKQLEARTFVDGELNTSGRIDAWEYIISLCENKFIGNGYGFLKTRTDYELKSFTAAHNEYIHLYLETGMIGVIIFFTIVLGIFIYHIRNGNNNKIKILYCAFLIGFLVYSIVDNTISNYHFFIPFMLLLSLFNINLKKKEV